MSTKMLYGIRNKNSKEFLELEGTFAWRDEYWAHLCFNNNMSDYYRSTLGKGLTSWQKIPNLFEIQTDFEIVRLRVVKSV